MAKLGPDNNTTAYICAGELVWYHILAFQELETVPPQKLGTVPPLGGPFSHYKNRGFEDFCDKYWCQLVFFCFVFLVQLVTSDLLFGIFPKHVFWTKRQKH